MSGILATLGSSLPAGAAIGAILGSCLIRLVCRLICVIELRMILWSLPRADRVTAAVVYIMASRARHPSPQGHRKPAGLVRPG